MAETKLEKDIWQILEEYCSDIKYGEIYIKVTVLHGRGVAFDEMQPPIRKFREIRSENNSR